MQKSLKISLIILAINVLSSCNWFNKPCEGYFILELINYKCQIINAIDGNNIYIVYNDYEEIKYDNLRISIKGEKEVVGNTNICSYMQDSFVNYISKIDIYSETDYGLEFFSGTNLNELFCDWYKGGELAINSTYNDNSTGSTYFLKTPPAQSDTFIFKINIEINDGRKYSFETLPIIITL